MAGWSQTTIRRDPFHPPHIFRCSFQVDFGAFFLLCFIAFSFYNFSSWKNEVAHAFEEVRYSLEESNQLVGFLGSRMTHGWQATIVPWTENVFSIFLSHPCTFYKPWREDSIAFLFLEWPGSIASAHFHLYAPCACTLSEVYLYVLQMSCITWITCKRGRNSIKKHAKKYPTERRKPHLDVLTKFSSRRLNVFWHQVYVYRAGNSLKYTPTYI